MPRKKARPAARKIREKLKTKMDRRSKFEARARPIRANPLVKRSVTDPRVIAEVTPSETPETMATTIEMPESIKVAGARSRITSSEFRLCQTESPKSPCIALADQIRYCITTGLSSPRSRPRASQISCEKRVPGVMYRSRGSPDILERVKTIIEMPIITTAIEMTRVIKKRPID